MTKPSIISLVHNPTDLGHPTKERPYSRITIQIPPSDHKNTNMNNQDNMSPPKTSTPLYYLLPEKRKLADAQDRDFNRAIINMPVDLEREMNK